MAFGVRLMAHGQARRQEGGEGGLIEVGGRKWDPPSSDKLRLRVRRGELLAGQSREISGVGSNGLLSDGIDLASYV